MKGVQQVNSLQRGELSGIEAAAPLTKAYLQGGEEVSGFDIKPQGLSPMRVPVAAEGEAFAYQANSYRGKYFLLNTVFATPTIAPPLPAEPAMTYKALDTKVRDLVASGSLRATPTDVTLSDFLDYRDSGKWTVDQGPTKGKLIDGTATAADRTVIITRKTTIYRAFWPCKGIGGSDGDLAGTWGLHAKRRVTRADWDSPSIGGGVTDYHGYDDTYYGCARGNAHAVKLDEKDGWLEKNNAKSEQWLELLTLELSPGVYQFTGDIYLVGKAKMFKTAPQDRAYQITVTNYAANGSTTMTEDRSWTEKEDALVLAWGGEAQIVNPTAHASAFSPPTFTKLDFPGAVSFWFTSRTIVVGARRFGPAMLEGDAEMFGATKTGYMGGSDAGDTGREIPNTGIDEATGYCVRVAGGASWFEEVASGILIGTPAAEYILGGHQVNPLKGGASLQKISAVGCVGASDFRLSISANLAGDVFYVSRYGITTLDFSNEQQVYLPRNFEFRSRRFSKVTSLAASVSEACLYFATDAGAVWKLWPQTGSLALVPVSIPTGRKILGVFSKGGDAYILVQKTVAEGSGEYVCPVAQARAAESYLRTTAFGRSPGTRTHIKKLLVTGYNLRSGEFRIEGGKWTGIPLTAAEVTDGFSGTKEFVVADRPGVLGVGKKVEFRFVAQSDQLTDPGTIESIGVEMEV